MSGVWRFSQGSIVAAAALLLTGLLLLTRLEDFPGWPDEYETCLLARRITQTGLPRLPLDGSWHVPIVSHWLTEGGVWIWTPWLDEYVAAASFMVFGDHLWAARLPFVCFGLASAVFVYRLAKRT